MARLLILLALAGSVAIWLYLERRARTAGRDRLARARAEFLNAAEPPPAGSFGHEAGRSLGVAGFRIPPHWREALGPDGAAVFSGPAPSTRSLRLVVHPLDREGLRPPAESVLTTLPDGRLLLKQVESSGARLLYTWRLADPDRARVAVFTLAVPSAEALDVLTADDLRHVEAAIRAATLG